MRITAVFEIITLVTCSMFAQEGEQKQPLFMSKTKHNELLNFWPKTTDETFNKLKNKVNFYTSSEMPGAYQNGGFAHSPYYNIAANPDPFGNANREFPWGHPAGLHISQNWTVVRFVYLSGPIYYWRQAERSVLDRAPFWHWQFSKGTIFGEILTVTNSNEEDYPFEVRIRERKENGWEATVYRPFPTLEKLQAALKKHGVEDYQPVNVRHATIQDRNPNKRAIKREAYLCDLPPLKQSLVETILTEATFEPVVGPFYKQGEGEDLKTVYAPTTKAKFHIVPKDYYGGMIQVSSKSCMGCHEHTGKDARSFDVNREWYGRVRGGDNILSFHIFEPSCISPNGANRQVVLRKALTNAGLLKHWE